ncbi:MAG: ATP-grasp domain-containing protein [Lachnospiraceae bacterium]|nr:ATP-grasp domain-containing protein [Lachnospiraceae bacterium]
MRRAWLIYGQEDAKKNKWYIEEFIKEAEKRDVKMELLLTEEMTFGVKDGNWFITYKGKVPKNPDFAVVRTIYPMLSRHLEYCKIPVFNNAKMAEICNDKARTYQYIAKMDIPIIDTAFHRKQELDRILFSIEEDTVVKAVAGHGGSQVFLVTKDTTKERREEIKEALASDFVRQPLTGRKHQDLRVYVLGNEILACVLRTAKEGFKSNFSLGGHVERYELSDSQREVVHKVMELFDIGLAGIDFLIGDDGNLIFNEVEDVVGARMLYQCMPDINLVGRYLDYILNRLNINLS